MEELLQACEDFPEVTLTLTGEKTYYVVGDEVPELVAYDAGTVFTEAKARSLEEIFAEGQSDFPSHVYGRILTLWTPSKYCTEISLIRAIAQFVVKTISLKSCHKGRQG